MQIRRRQLLQIAGLGTGSLFLPSLLRGQDQGIAPPKRLVIFETQHGPVNYDSQVPGLAWEMRPPGLSGARDAQWEIALADASEALFKRQLAPLYPHRRELLMLEGLAYTTAIAAPAGNNPGVSIAHRFACAGDTSFEQYIADAVKAPGQFPYIHYTNNAGDVDKGGHYKDGAKIPATRLGPSQYSFFTNAFDRLFGDLEDGEPGSMEEEAPTRPSPAELSRLRRNPKVDFLQAQYQALLGRVGSEDRKKLQAHHDLLSDLKRDVGSLQDRQRELLACEKPQWPPQVAMSGHEITEIALSKLFPIAMACDLTRVGVYWAKQLDTSEFGGPAGQDVHQDIAHAGNAGEAAQHLASYYELHAREFASLIDAFKSVPEGNGTMLDNSLLIWIPELANGWHRFWNVMTIMAGGLAGSFKTGRYIKYAESSPNPRGERGSGEEVALGPAYNKLYVSIMQAMGVGRDSIGQRSVVAQGFGTGTIDLTGPLPGLRG